MYSQILLALIYSLNSINMKKNSTEIRGLKDKIHQLCYCFENINLALHLDNLIEGF